MREAGDGHWAACHFDPAFDRAFEQPRALDKPQVVLPS
jgi:hypothetical protein